MDFLFAFFGDIMRDIKRALSPDLPKELGNMDDHLAYILPKVIPYGEDLRETQFWHNKRWKEVREEEGFHEAILHIFTPEGEYLNSLDGNLMRGTWRQIGVENVLIVELGGKSELFDLRFLNHDFMVLTKHGDQQRKGMRRYFLLVREPATRDRYGRELDWRNIMERLYNIWRENSLNIWAWVFFLLLLAFIIYYSFK